MRKVLFQKLIDNSNLSEMINEGYFHTFATDDGGDLYAIIESTDGLLIDVKPGRFKFIEPLEAIDWEQRRYELSKAAMEGLLSNSAIIDLHDNETIEWITYHSVLQADTLIAELKKQKQ